MISLDRLGHGTWRQPGSPTEMREQGLNRRSGVQISNFTDDPSCGRGDRGADRAHQVEYTPACRGYDAGLSACRIFSDPQYAPLAQGARGGCRLAAIGRKHGRERGAGAIAWLWDQGRCHCTPKCRTAKPESQSAALNSVWRRGTRSHAVLRRTALRLGPPFSADWDA